MQSFLVNDKNLWVYILHVFYCITLVFSLKENKIPQSFNAFIVAWTILANMKHVCAINSNKNCADFLDLRYFLLHTQPHSIFLRYPEIVSQLK